MRCPVCQCNKLIEGNISYNGCITDEIRGREDTGWNHKGYRCKECNRVFTLWDDGDDFEEITSKTGVKK